MDTKTRTQRLKEVEATLRKIYGAEPCKAPDDMKRQLQRLKEMSPDDSPAVH